MVAIYRRVTDVAQSATTVKVYVAGVVVISWMSITAIILLAIFVPDQPNLINTVMAITMPIIASLLGASVHGMAKNVDGKMDYLIETVGEKKKLEGYVNGLKENPNTNIS